jgi:hypothetical protein
MKTSLDHLPEPKQAQLRDITAIFREGAPLGMLILFGSHARYRGAGAAGREQHALLQEALPKTEPEDRRLFDLLKK